ISRGADIVPAYAKGSGAGVIGQGIKIGVAEQVFGSCAETSHGNLIVRERCAGGESGTRVGVANNLIVYGQELAQITGAPCSRSHGSGGRPGDAAFRLLI